MLLQETALKKNLFLLQNPHYQRKDRIAFGEIFKHVDEKNEKEEVGFTCYCPIGSAENCAQPCQVRSRNWIL